MRASKRLGRRTVLMLTALLMLTSTIAFPTGPGAQVASAAGTKIALTTAMVVNEESHGDATLMVDEQTTAGDPQNGSGGTPSTQWNPGAPYYNNYPSHAYIDLGQEYNLTGISLFDTNGNSTVSPPDTSQDLIVSAGSPGSWTNLFTDPLGKYMAWSNHTVSVTTRYVRVTVQFVGDNFSEIVLYGTPAGDTTAPSAVSNLAAPSATTSSVTLTWTAPGDDGATGTATSYDVRYSTSAITSGNWASATQASGEPTPGASGASQSMTVSGLSASTTYYFALKATDEASNVSAISNVVSKATTSPADSTAPAAVTNLAAPSSTSGSVTLTWTAPGDDGSTGTATSYDVRYSTSTITSGNWSSATQASGEPTPGAAGASQTLTVNGLSPNTTYYFALTASDEVPNVSAISNVVGKATASAGKITLTTAMVVNEQNRGDATTMVDEQTLAGDPANGSGGTPTTQWNPGAPYYNNYPSYAYIDLGQEYALTGISYFDTNGNAIVSPPDTSQNLIVSAGSPGSWTELFSDPMPKYLAWTNRTVNVTTRYVRFTVQWSGDNFSEVVLYGTPTGSDASAPAAVSNLAAPSSTGTSVSLTWTAPGDDGLTGTASSYDIRYSTSAITDGNWASATQASGEPTPGAAGASQSMTVSGLTGSTTYYFALKTSDESSNVSALSNVVSKATTTPDTTAPAAVSNLAAPSSTSGSVTLTWTAPGDDGSTGTATSYDVRYSTSTITSGNWASATQASGEPTPGAAGASQTMTVSGLAASTTYYFAIKATDEASNVAAISNVVSKATVAGGGKITLSPSMITNEAAVGDATTLVDEQTLAGNPKGGAGGVPVTEWDTTWSGPYYPATFILDLGADYALSDIYFFDTDWGGSNVVVSSGSPFSWTPLVTENLATYQNWIGRTVNVTTRYLQFKVANCCLNVSEIVLYGTALGTPATPPTPSPLTLPTMDQFMGMNALFNDSASTIEPTKFIREYHIWGWEESVQNQLKFNPSNGETAGVYWNFDDYYDDMKTGGYTVIPAINQVPSWLTSGASEKPVSSGDDPLLPASYIEHAQYMYQFAARYGSTAVADNKLRLASGQPRVSGLNLLNYLEGGNEPDKTWAGRASYSNPYELAAQLSADFDGHQGAMGNTAGVKTADPNMKLVMPGLLSLNLEYLKSIKVWADYYRSGSLPFDVINMHHYSSDWSPTTSQTTGVSPEANGLKDKLKKIVDYRNQYMPGKEFWLTEFGYDTHTDSIQGVSPISGVSANDVQADWLVRAYMAIAAAGVDKAFMFFSHDTVPGGSGMFQTSGIETNGTKKPSYYAIYTLRNRLTGMRYLSEAASGNANVNIYKFKSATGSGGAYVIWAPTANNTTVNGYQLTLAGTPTSATLVTMANGDTDGVSSALTISGGKVTVNVSERPIYVLVDNMQ
ncbi:fibronectin type III domain-containing protein [Cohnella sp. GCM10027633]|uniref:fibronectin type III domain-containing protein n=1 Tax=unclassified Cohnella TaxID=2636738 RepID=UPI00362BD553